MKNILVSVVGLTPQVLTETLCYYTAISKPPVTFDSIHVITTATGKRQVLDKLLKPNTGQFHRFCREYGVTGLAFDESNIHVIGGKRPLEDIRTISDNGLMAGEVLGLIRELTSDPSTALYCSLAGGRKTMGAYLALALQLYGRAQDRLTHVLVTTAFETSPDFFYVPPENRVIRGRDAFGREVILQTREAIIELADIPFVSVRRLLPKRGDFPLEELVRKLQLSVLGPQPAITVRFDLRRKKVWVNDIAVALPPKELSVYALFAMCRKACRRRSCAGCTDCFLGMNELTTRECASKILPIYGTIVGLHSGHYDRLRAAWEKSEPDEQYFLEAISKINAKLRKTVAESDYPRVEIASSGGYGEKRYGIRMDKTSIRFSDDAR